MLAYQTPTRSFLWHGKSWTLTLGQLCWCTLEQLTGKAFLDVAEDFVGEKRGHCSVLHLLLFALTAEHRMDNRLSFPRTEFDRELGQLVPSEFIRQLPQSVAEMRSLRSQVMEMLAEEDLLVFREVAPAKQAEEGEDELPLDQILPASLSTGSDDLQTEQRLESA